MTGRPVYALRDYTLEPESARRIAVALEHEHMTTATARALDTPPAAAGREAQAAVLDVLRDLLAQHGLEPVLHPGPGGEWCVVEETPRGHTLAVTVARVGDGAPVLTLPSGAYVEQIGTEPTPEPEYVSVTGDDVPPVARALVNAWWSENATTGSVRRPYLPGLFGDGASNGWVRHDTAIEYAATLERVARELRETVERGRVEDQTRRGDYSAALRLLADAMSGDAAVATARAADIIGSGKGRLAAAVDLGLDSERWVLTTKPEVEDDGEE